MNKTAFPQRAPKNDNKSPVWELYGNRFFADQGPLELLSELLLICFSKKNYDGYDFSCIFPAFDNINDIVEITYYPNYRIPLKLFALYNHQTGDRIIPYIEETYNRITSDCANNIDTSDYKKEILVDVFKSMYKGFAGIGVNRDWCAQSFLPISKNLLAGESIWTNRLSKEKKLESWGDISENISHNKRAFYSRGGEVLFLQLLLALNQPKNKIVNLVHSDKYRNIHFTEDELSPDKLRQKLNNGFSSIYCNKVPEFFNTFVNNLHINEEDEIGIVNNKVYMGFIPNDAWEYGYLFAVELSRLFESSFDIVDLIKHLENASVLQLIRTLLWASSDYLGTNRPFLPVVPSQCNNTNYKLISNEAFNYSMRLICRASNEVAGENGNNNLSRYGYKLFQKIGKSIGLIQPPRGGLEHFVLSKDLVVLLVSTTLLPGQTQTFDNFLKEIEARYGLVVDSDGFNKANGQSNKNQKIDDRRMVDWIIDILRECDYFVELSDSISLVKNTNISEGKNEK